MRTVQSILVLVASLLAIGFYTDKRVEAQNYALTPFVITGNAPCKNNFVAQAGVTAYCFGNDMAEYSISGGAVTQFIPVGAATNPSITINGTTKTLPASFTLATPSTVNAN